MFCSGDLVFFIGDAQFAIGFFQFGFLLLHLRDLLVPPCDLLRAGFARFLQVHHALEAHVVFTGRIGA